MDIEILVFIILVILIMGSGILVWKHMSLRSKPSEEGDAGTRKAFDVIVQEMVKKNKPFAVLICDLDRFKDVSNSIGFRERGRIIDEMYRRLQAANQKSIYSGLLRGKEYISVVPYGTPAEMDRLTHHMMMSFRKPFYTKMYSVFITASIGWCFAPEDGITSSGLLRKADIALRQAKNPSGGIALRYAPEMGNRLDRRLAMMKDIRVGTVSDEFIPWFQPRIEVGVDGRLRCTSAEALARWRRPNGEMIYPGEFINVAEDCGLIVELGETILLKACIELRRWEKEFGDAAPNVSVNISPKQFSMNVPAMIRRMLKATGASAQKLEIEITESAAFTDHEKVKSALHEISDMGVSIAIDDFGTGYSSFSYLKVFPVNTLKVDASFVKSLPDHDTDKAMIEAMRNIASIMGLSLIIEGVENQRQLDFLVNSGCREIQGFFFAKPMEGSDFIQWVKDLNERQNNHP